MYPKLILWTVIKEKQSTNLNHLKLPFLSVKNGQQQQFHVAQPNT